jgi:carnitine O-acetyltransferase
MQFLTGGLGLVHYRWFDKSIQLMCTANGKSGVFEEHSMIDRIMVDHIAKSTYIKIWKPIF